MYKNRSSKNAQPINSWLFMNVAAHYLFLYWVSYSVAVAHIRCWEFTERIDWTCRDNSSICHWETTKTCSTSTGKQWSFKWGNIRMMTQRFFILSNLLIETVSLINCSVCHSQDILTLPRPSPDIYKFVAGKIYWCIGQPSSSLGIQYAM